MALPVIVLGEYRLGIAQSRQREVYETWLSECVAAVDILEIEEATSHHYAAIGLELKGAGKPIPTNNIWIAALCRQHSLPLLSRDRHFDAVSGIKRIDWQRLGHRKPERSDWNRRSGLSERKHESFGRGGGDRTRPQNSKVLWTDGVATADQIHLLILLTASVVMCQNSLSFAKNRFGHSSPTSQF